jgi:hypothetical protein
MRRQSVGRVVVETEASNATLVVTSKQITTPAVNATLSTAVNNVDSPVGISIDLNSSVGRIESLELVRADGTRIPTTEQCPTDAAVDACVAFVPDESTWNGSTYRDMELTIRVTNGTGTTTTAEVSTPVYIAGDTNGDGRVDIFDAVTVGRAWQTSRGDPGYSDAADLNNDGQVNIFDAVVIGRNWQAIAT